MNKIPVWFDTDIGVDDAVAFLVLHRQPELEVVGISAVSGNVGLEHTYPNARNICHLVGARYPVYKVAPFMPRWSTLPMSTGRKGWAAPGWKAPPPRTKARPHGTLYTAPQ